MAWGFGKKKQRNLAANAGEPSAAIDSSTDKAQDMPENEELGATQPYDDKPENDLDVTQPLGYVVETEASQPIVADDDDAYTEPIDYAKGYTYSVSHMQTIGMRNEQQDSLCYSNYKSTRELSTRGLLAAVCDGIGGIPGGEKASQVAVQTMYNMFMQQSNNQPAADRLLALTTAAHQAVVNLREGGTTLVSCLIVEGKLYITAVGDSHIYLYRNGALLLLNRVHVHSNRAKENRAFGVGSNADDNGRAAALTAYLGQQGLRQIDRTTYPITLVSGDRILLMSDGVFGTLTEEDILLSMKMSATGAAKDIIQRVEEIDKRNQDNATVLIIEVE